MPLRSSVSLAPARPIVRFLWRLRRFAWRKTRHLKLFLRDRLIATYNAPPTAIAKGRLDSRLPPLRLDLPDAQRKLLTELSARVIDHRINLLGSGWVKVRHGMVFIRPDGPRYNLGQTIVTDAHGRWLTKRLNGANVAIARRVWNLVDAEYRPFDWQLDFKSGYRWSERKASRHIRYGTVTPGADIKMPWELARMQHLPWLGLTYSLAKETPAGFLPKDIYARQFRNQVIDFIATNPPRFGANWVCTMDVGIRVANWLLAYDLFKQAGFPFDTGFEQALLASVYDHARHIVENLEWYEEFRGNHYLADIVGLMYAAAYLPISEETDAWLAFATQEFLAALDEQFLPDGGNFEVSTSYHRLSAEMALFGAALLAGLPDERQAAYAGYSHGVIEGRPGLKKAPLPLHPVPGAPDRASPLQPGHWRMLEAMAWAAHTLRRPDGTTPQFGDTDNGRFFKILPPFSTDGTYDERHLDHTALLAVGYALFGTPAWAFAAELHPADVAVVRGLSRGLTVQPALKGPEPLPHFGAHVLKNDTLWVAVRAGTVGDATFGGHAHHDQLGFDLCAEGYPLIVDPGTGAYTAAPAVRAQLRSSRQHATLSLAGRDQLTAAPGNTSVFAPLSGRTQVTTSTATEFLGTCENTAHTRHLHLNGGTLRGRDETRLPDPATLNFPLAPGVTVARDDGGVMLMAGPHKYRLSGGPGTWSVDEGLYSAAYGETVKTKIVRLTLAGPQADWHIEKV